MNDAARLTTPLDPEAVADLTVGRAVLISGTLVTARDEAHRHLAEGPADDRPPYDLTGGIIYHCGPIVEGSGDNRRVVSAGPTTSMRMEMFEPRIIEQFGVRAIIGKGGMGAGTARALTETGGVYLAAPSGAGALLARRIKRVIDVWKLEEFGAPEALWRLEVEDFPALVAMDARGGDLYARVEKSSADALRRLLGGGEK